MAKSRKPKRKTWFNYVQKDGLARVLDGYSIVEGITLFSHLAGRFELTVWEILGLLFLLFSTIVCSFLLRKD